MGKELVDIGGGVNTNRRKGTGLWEGAWREGKSRVTAVDEGLILEPSDERAGRSERGSKTRGKGIEGSP